MTRRDCVSRVISAPLDRVFHALVDRSALETWLPPDGMTARFERFDPTPGGSYRLILTYADPDDRRCEEPADADIVEARYVDIVQDDRVVQAVDFVSDDPAFAGTMTMTWAVHAVDDGTLVEFIADDVPVGISAEDHSAEWRRRWRTSPAIWRLRSDLDHASSWRSPTVGVASGGGASEGVVHVEGHCRHHDVARRVRDRAGRGPEHGLGDAPELHAWVSEQDSVDVEILEGSTAASGAVVMGRRLFDTVDGPDGWSTEMGYGAEQAGTPPFFVVTHSPPQHVRLEQELGMSFTFVPDPRLRSTRPGRLRSTETS